MRRRFFINPTTRGQRGGRAIELLGSWFRDRTGQFDAVLPRDREDCLREARRALQEGVEQLVAVGGDGTVNAVANGFFDESGEPLRPEATLAVAPRGTGCDYFRGLTDGNPGPLDWREILLSGKTRATDLGRISYAASGRHVHFVNAASVGLSAEVVRRQRSLPRWLPPLASYSLPAFGALLRFRPVPLEITLDGRPFGGNFLAAFFAKGVYLGGGMRFGGAVTADDGRFDVTLLHGMTLLESLPRFGKIFTGRFDGDPKITKTTARDITISATVPQPTEFDGELEGTTDLRITVVPRAIRLCVP